MNDIYNIAIMLIYPDGHIDKMYVDRETLHSHYYKELANKNSRFKQIVDARNIDIDNYDFEVNIDLVNKDNIIVINNIDIRRIVEEKDFLEKNVPYFLFGIPEQLTDEQKSVLLDLFENNYLNSAAYAHLKEEGPEPINYYDLLNSLYDTKIK